MIRIGIMVGAHGRGSNMQAIIDGCSDGRVDGEVVVVIGTRGDAPAIEKAVEQGIPTTIINPKDYADSEAYGDALLDALKLYDVDLLCLAGYMRLLPSTVVHAYEGHIMNIHPALLPLFGGKGMYGEHVHQAVIESGMKVSGCTVHFVDDRYDHGAIILQTSVMVEENDTPDTLAARVLPCEHKAYVEAVSLFAQGRLKLEGKRVKVVPKS